MGVRINKSRQHDASAQIHNFRVRGFLLDLVAWTDDVDLAVANKQPAIADDPELGQFLADAWTFRTCQRDKLRRVKESERLQALNNLSMTIL